MGSSRREPPAGRGCCSSCLPSRAARPPRPPAAQEKLGPLRGQAVWKMPTGGLIDSDALPCAWLPCYAARDVVDRPRGHSCCRRLSLHSTPHPPPTRPHPTRLSTSGLVQQGEDVTEAAEREVLEETGVRARFDGVIAMRQVRLDGGVSKQLGRCRRGSEEAGGAGSGRRPCSAACCARAHVRYVCRLPAGAWIRSRQV